MKRRAFVPGTIVRYRGIVTWPDGRTSVTAKQLCLVVAQHNEFELAVLCVGAQLITDAQLFEAFEACNDV